MRSIEKVATRKYGEICWASKKERQFKTPGSSDHWTALTGLQSPQTNMGCPNSFLKDPVALGLCTPHLKQLIVPMAKVLPLKGDPATLDL